MAVQRIAVYLFLQCTKQYAFPYAFPEGIWTKGHGRSVNYN